MNTNRLKQIFTDSAATLREMSRTEPELKSGPMNEPLVIRSGLVLHGNLARHYLSTLSKICELLKDNAAWSRPSVDDALSEHLYKVFLAAHEGHDVLSDEAKSFVQRFRQEPSVWGIGLAVFGLADDCAGLSFGNLVFETHAFTPDFTFGNQLQKDRPAQAIFAQVSAEAVDRETALLRAQENVDLHLAVLNALCSDSWPSTIHLSRDFSDKGLTLEISRYEQPNLDDSGTLLNSRRKRRLLHRIDFESRLSLDQDSGHRIGAFFKEPTEFRNQLISAYALVGTAEFENQRYSAYLLYAIALESALMGKTEKPEISQQLALRVAHLLVNGVESRKEMLDRMKDLYKLRSNIVHSGWTQVSEGKLNELRQITLMSLHILSSHIAFTNIATFKDLDTWFLERLLDSTFSI